MASIPVLDRVEDAVRRRGADLIELSHAIHAEPELAFAEQRSCAKTQSLAAERGFEITAAAGGLDTAFRADFGAGPLAVGVCAEYDALPGIGHACGHNIIAASAVGAALALADVADELGLKVALLGTPAEEFGGGKVLLLNAGVFDDLVAAVMMHPGPVDIAAARSLTLSAVRVEYRGREAHASAAPFLGVNAADATTVAQVAIGLLRQQLAHGQQVHGIVSEAARSPTSSRAGRNCSTRCAPPKRCRLPIWKARWATASWPARSPPAVSTALSRPSRCTTRSSPIGGWPVPSATR